MPNVAYTPSAATRIVRRTANSAAKTDNTLANDDTLLWAVAANEKWFFQAWLFVNSANSTMDDKFGWSVPSGTTMLWGGLIGATSTGHGGFGPTTLAAVPLLSLVESATLASGSAANATYGLTMAGVVSVSSTPGIVNLQWAQNTTDAGNLILMADSFLQLTRLA